MNTYTKPTTAQMDHHGTRLRWMAEHDYWLAILFAIATFAFVPFAVLILPFLWLLHLAIDLEKVDATTETSLRSRHSIPRNVLIRQSRKGNTEIFSTPLGSVMQVGQALEDDPTSGVSARVVAHELQHHSRHDGAVFTWLLCSCLVFAVGSLISIPLLLTQNVIAYNFAGRGDELADMEFFTHFGSYLLYAALASAVLAALAAFLHFKARITVLTPSRMKWLGYVLAAVLGISIGQYLIQPMRTESFRTFLSADMAAGTDQLYRTGWFWYLSLLSVSAIALLTLRRVLHRFEFIADNQAAREDTNGYIDQLRERAHPKIRRTSPKIVDRFLNSITHPSRARRLDEIVSAGRDIEKRSIFFSLLFWSASAGLCFAIAMIDGASSFGRLGVGASQAAGVVGFVLVAGLLGRNMLRLMFVEKRLLSRELAEAITGYALGLGGSLTLVFTLEFFVFEIDGFSYSAYVLMYPVAVVVVLALSFCSAALLFLLKTNTSAMFGLSIVAAVCGYVPTFAYFHLGSRYENHELLVAFTFAVFFVALLLLTLTCALIVHFSKAFKRRRQESGRR